MQRKQGNAESKKMDANDGQTRFYIVCMLLFGILIFYPPYFRGLYFEDEQFPAQWLMFLLMGTVALYKGLRKEALQVKTPLEYAFLGLFIIYALSLLPSVSLRSALSECLKYGYYFACFFLASELFRSYRHRVRLVWTLIASVFGVCIISLDAAFGPRPLNEQGIEATYGPLSVLLNHVLDFFGFKQSFFDLYIYGKIYSTYQYTNAFASVALACFLLSIVLLLHEKKPALRGLLGGISFFLFASMLLAQSRALMVLIPVILLVFIFAIQRGLRMRVVTYLFLISMLSIGIVYSNFDLFTQAKERALQAWLIMGMGMLASVAMTLGINRCMGFLEARWKMGLKILAGLSLLLMGMGVYAVSQTEALHLAMAKNDPYPSHSSIKSMALIPGKHYRLHLNISGKKASGAETNYFIKIHSKNIQDILTDNTKELLYKQGDATQGVTPISIDFQVPADSRSMLLEFGVDTKDTEALFSDAVLLDPDTGEAIKNIPLQYAFIPKRIVSSFENIRFSKSVVEREIFNLDGIRLFQKHWLLGAGGGAWSHLYSSEQSYLYWTTQAHNYFLQLGIETGIFGILLFVLLLCAVILQFVAGSLFIPQEETAQAERTLQGGIFGAIFGMVLHVAFDFDFSLSAVFMLFCVLLGLLNSRHRSGLSGEIPQGSKPWRKHLAAFVSKLTKHCPKMKLPLWLAGPVLCILLLMSVSLYRGIVNYNAGKAFEKTDPDKALLFYQRAVDADPLQPLYRNAWISLLMLKKEVKEEDIIAIGENMNQVQKDAQYSVKEATEAGTNLLRLGETEKGLAMLQRATQLRPRREGEWGNYLAGHLRAISYLDAQEKQQEAMDLANKALRIPTEIKKANERNLNPFSLGSSSLQALEMLAYYAETPQNKEHFADVIFYALRESVDADGDGWADQWRKGGDPYLLLRFQNGTLQLENSAAEVKTLSTRALQPEAGKTYEIKLKTLSENVEGNWEVSLLGLEKKQLLSDGKGNFTAQMKVPDTYAEKNPVLVWWVPPGVHAVETFWIREKNEPLS